MSPIKTILTATDFSAPGESAVEYALNLAENLHAKVVLLHALEFPNVGLPDGAMVPTEDIVRRIENASQKALTEAVAKYRDRKVEITPLIEHGDAREIILRVAKNVGADLIVMGTHGRRGIARALIGSVTERVVRTSSVPVLTVHAENESQRR